MEQNTPMIAKKIWNLLRVALYMIRKGMCKRKILMDLTLVMKRGKIAGKALQNIMFHHDSSLKGGLEDQFTPRGDEYEFSCSDTPLYRQYFTHNKRKTHHNNNKKYSIEDMDNVEDVNNVFDMIMLSGIEDVAKSPALGLGFGKQIRVTDSPFPTQIGEDGKHVDVAADEFIKKFYSQLKQQKNY